MAPNVLQAWGLDRAVARARQHLDNAVHHQDGRAREYRVMRDVIRAHGSHGAGTGGGYDFSSEIQAHQSGQRRHHQLVIENLEAWRMEQRWIDSLLEASDE